MKLEDMSLAELLEEQKRILTEISLLEERYSEDNPEIVVEYTKLKHQLIQICSILGYMFYNGKKIPVDKIKASQLFSLEAQLGSARGKYNLATILFTGDGIPADKSRAISLFRDSARQGYVCSQHSLACILMQEKGVADHVEAARLLLLVKKNKEFMADSELGMTLYNNLGIMFYNGDGIAVDKHQAFKFFSRAKERIPESKKMLGIMLVNGDSTMQDVRYGVELLREVAKSGDIKASMFLGVFCVKL